MDYINQMPWTLVLDDNVLDCAVFKIPDEINGEPCYEMNVYCELADEDDTDPCSEQPYVLGTSDSREPKFCFKHYFRSCAGDGHRNYKIVFNQK